MKFLPLITLALTVVIFTSCNKSTQVDKVETIVQNITSTNESSPIFVDFNISNSNNMYDSMGSYWTVNTDDGMANGFYFTYDYIQGYNSFAINEILIKNSVIANGTLTYYNVSTVAEKRFFVPVLDNLITEIIISNDEGEKTIYELHTTITPYIED